MEPTPVYSAVTIYYSQTSWHKLMRNCINTFHHSLMEENLPYCFFIFLGIYKGDHIRIYVYSNAIAKEAFHNDLEESIIRFLLDNPSKQSKNPVPTDLFMNIPNNSIVKEVKNINHINNFTRYYNYQNLHNYLSKVIVEISSLEKLNYDVLLSYSFYLHLTVVKVLFSKISISSESIETLMESCLTSDLLALNTSDLLDSDSLDSFYFENHILIFEIVNNVMKEYKPNEFEWLAEGELLFKAEFEKTDIPFMTCNYIFNMINEHLGLPNQHSLMILQLLSKNIHSLFHGNQP